MRVIIIGCGRLGSTLAKELSDAGHDVSIIDHDSDRLNVLGSGFNGQRIKGVEFDDDLLRDAGIQNSDVLLAVTPDDNINITVSLIAKKIYAVHRIITRINDQNRKYIYDNLGIETINPTQLGVTILTSRITVKSLDMIAALDKDYDIVELSVLKDKVSTVKAIEEKYSCIISGVLKDGKFMLPAKEELISSGSKMICTINKKNRDHLISAFSKEG